MAEHSDSEFMELLDLQGNLEMVTKSELIEEARKRGAAMSDRQLISLVSEGLLPKSARIGSRGGAYPKLVVRQLVFVSRFRKRGLSVQAIRELLPLWKYMQRALRDRELSLEEFQYVARESITVPEAWYAAPAVLQECLPCPFCLAEDYADLTIRLKDNTVCKVGDQISIGFAMVGEDPETHKPEFKARTRIAVPQPDEGFNSSSIILGVPNGAELPSEPPHRPVAISSGPASGRDQAGKGD
ncbi:MAG TPA: hypothetical protein VHB02_08685 [Acidimicrobiales bacterium]|nr:hypothetical protein [Acidimicrobiales bacterium]